MYSTQYNCTYTLILSALEYFNGSAGEQHTEEQEGIESNDLGFTDVIYGVFG